MSFSLRLKQIDEIIHGHRLQTIVSVAPPASCSTYKVVSGINTYESGASSFQNLDLLAHTQASRKKRMKKERGTKGERERHREIDRVR